MRKGKRIALYGIPKAGKSTQADILVQTFKRKDFQAEYIQYPMFKEEPSGSFLNEYLNKGKYKNITERELQLWFAINRMQYQPTLKNDLEEPVAIVTENDLGMSFAYGMLAGVKREWLEAVNEPVLKPDLSIFITRESVIDDAPTGTARTLRNLQEIYHELAMKHAWYTVDGDQKMMEVHMNIWDVVKKII